MLRALRPAAKRVVGCSTNEAVVLVDVSFKRDGAVRIVRANKFRCDGCTLSEQAKAALFWCVERAASRVQLQPFEGQAFNVRLPFRTGVKRRASGLGLDAQQ